MSCLNLFQSTAEGQDDIMNRLLTVNMCLKFQSEMAIFTPQTGQETAGILCLQYYQGKGQMDLNFLDGAI